MNLAPRCIADHCPRCRQPWNPASADAECSQCLNRHLMEIAACGKTADSRPLDRGIIGSWRSPSGLVISLVENSKGFWGYASWIPKSLAKRYPSQWQLITKLARKSAGEYQGVFLAPSGKWVPVTVRIEQKKLRTIFANKVTVEWRKTIRLKRNDTAPAPMKP